MRVELNHNIPRAAKHSPLDQPCHPVRERGRNGKKAQRYMWGRHCVLLFNNHTHSPVAVEEGAEELLAFYYCSLWPVALSSLFL